MQYKFLTNKININDDFNDIFTNLKMLRLSMAETSILKFNTKYENSECVITFTKIINSIFKSLGSDHETNIKYLNLVKTMGMLQPNLESCIKDFYLNIKDYQTEKYVKDEVLKILNVFHMKNNLEFF